MMYTMAFASRAAVTEKSRGEVKFLMKCPSTNFGHFIAMCTDGIEQNSFVLNYNRFILILSFGRSDHSAYS